MILIEMSKNKTVFYPGKDFNHLSRALYLFRILSPFKLYCICKSLYLTVKPLILASLKPSAAGTPFYAIHGVGVPAAFSASCRRQQANLMFAPS
jgi:hypothetical protein